MYLIVMATPTAFFTAVNSDPQVLVCVEVCLVDFQYVYEDILQMLGFLLSFFQSLGHVHDLHHKNIVTSNPGIVGKGNFGSCSS